jgi:hypothetical protein
LAAAPAASAPPLRALAVLIGLAVVAAGAMALVAPAAAGTSPADSGVPPPVQPAPAVAEAPPAKARHAVPYTIEIPALHLRAGVVPVSAPAGDLDVPTTPAWSDGGRPEPGQQARPAPWSSPGTWTQRRVAWAPSPLSRAFNRA